MRFFVLFIAAASLSTVAGAQGSVADLPPGTRVRVEVPGTSEPRLIGSLARQGPASLTISRGKSDREVTVPLDQVASVRRSTGRSRGVGAVVGAIGGAVAGVVLGIACVSVCQQENSTDANLAPAGGFMVGLPAGALLGALIGVERWQHVRLR